MSAAKDNLWLSIRESVQKREDLHDSHLILLGDRDAGKRTILREINKSQIQGKNKAINLEQMGSNFAALDNHFLYVKDLSDPTSAQEEVTQGDNLAKLNVWALYEPAKWDLLEAVIPPSDLEKSCAVIVLDLERPECLMQSLRSWVKALREFVFHQAESTSMPTGSYERLRQKLEKHIKMYEDPVIDKHGNVIMTVKNNNAQDEEAKESGDEQEELAAIKGEMELAEGVL